MLGQYDYMSTALSEFTDAVFALLNGAGLDPLIETAPPVVTFMSGAVVGLFTVAHTVRWALKHYREATLAFLVSLIVGALRAPVEQSTIALSEAGLVWTTDTIGLFVLFAIGGAIAVVAVDRLAGGIETSRSG